MCYRKNSYEEARFDRYFFEKDIFGNIVAVYNESGTKVASYAYDAWGNCTISKNVDGIGALNPFRYRGYYLDTETNLYYLQTRYYDSYVGRFINADNATTITASMDALTDKNLFSYCDNNPVMRTDEDGEFWNILAGAVCGAVINIGVSWICAAISGEEYTWKDALVDGLSGAITGACAATGLGAFAQAGIGAAVGAATSIATDVIHGEEINVTRALNAAAMGGISGYIGGAGLRKDPVIKGADRTCVKVLLKVESGAYATVRGAKSAMTQAINNLHKVLVPAVMNTTKNFIKATVLNSLGLRFYDQLNA